MFLSRPFKEDIFSYSRKSNNLENWPTQFFLSCFSAILQLGWVWGPRAISPAAGVWRSFPPPHHPLQGGLSGPRDGQRVMSKVGWIVCKQLFIQFCGKLHAIFVTTWCYVLLSFFILQYWQCDLPPLRRHCGEVPGRDSNLGWAVYRCRDIDH